MKLVLCLDDGHGMMFNHRRQSRDRVLIEDLLRHTAGHRLWVTPYSSPLFPPNTSGLTVANDLTATDSEDYCFVETFDPAPLWDRVSEVIVYRWNRLYPADIFFTGDLSALHLTETTEFAGSSHDKITKEVWKK